MGKRNLWLGVLCVALLGGGTADAASNSAITVPDAVAPDTAFDIGLLGEFVRGGGVNRFELWQDASWSYDALHRVVIAAGTGTLLDSDSFFFGDLDETFTLVGGLSAGTYTFTLVFGRSFAHSQGNVGVDIELTVGAATQAVDIDIKPTSCPNPINVGARGLVSVAILGGSDLDAGDVDPDTVLLEGVAPVRYAYEDAAAPFDPDVDEGYGDLVLKFDKQDLVAALGAVEDGDELILELTGELVDGTAIEGHDCIVIRKKGK
jgi:hypothetical protein